LKNKKSNLPFEICKSCKKSFYWRKKWEKDWENIVYGLYWNFIHNNKQVLSKNPRMGMAIMS